MADTLGQINPIRYRSYYYDIETGFYYLNSRYYDPDVKRFINSDSYISTGDGIFGTNMFAYCMNNPVIYADLNGEFIFFSVDIGVLPVPPIAPPISIPAAPTLPLSPRFVMPNLNDFLNYRGRIEIASPSDSSISTSDTISNTIPDTSSIVNDIENAPSNKSSYKPKRPAARKTYPTRKAAEQAARKAGKGKKPIIHGPKNGQPPHFHPNVEQLQKLTRNMVTRHDHYYFPKSKFSYNFIMDPDTNMPIINWC